MAYPLKRRKISYDQYHPPKSGESSETTSTGSYSHGVQAVAAEPPSEDGRSPMKIEELHVKVKNYQAGHERHRTPEDAHRHIHRRQGTGATAVVSVENTVPPASVIVSVGTDGSASFTTATGTLSSSTSVATAPTDVSSSLTTSSSPLTSSDAILPPASSTSIPTTAEMTSPMSSAPSSSSSLNSTGQSVTSSSSTNPDGMIGITPTSAAPATTSASTTPSGSTFLSSNATMTTSSGSASAFISGIISATSEGASASSALSSHSSLSSSVSNGLNLTSSALSITSGSSTFTSYSTFGLSSFKHSSRSTSISASTSARTTSSRSRDLETVVSTLPNGARVTLLEGRQSRVTTLSNGQVSTSYGSYAPISTIGSSRAPETSSARTSITSSSNESSGSSYIATSTTDGAAGGGLASSTGSASAATSSAAGGGGDSNTPPAPVLAGGIVGGVAGLAVVLLVAMLFIRWYRRRSAMQPLASPEGTRDLPTSPHTPGMAERAGILPLSLAAGGLFRNRQSTATVPTGQQGFQKISGRKLPSAFSEGMEAAPRGTGAPGPVPMPAAFENSRNLSNASFFRDSTGFYGGTGSSGENVHELESNSPTELQQGPRRTPTVHPGGPYTLSPGETPPMSPRAGLLQGRAPTPVNAPLSPTGTFGRSDTPATMASHGSRFIEEV